MNYNVLSIIEPSEVRTIAFSDVGSVPEAMLSQYNIEYAISRFVAPVVGHALLEEVSLGSYGDFRLNYLQQAVAFYVRYISSFDSDSEALHILTRARHYLRAASDHLESNSGDYAEYDGAKNILNRCRIHGDMVQIL